MRTNGTSTAGAAMLGKRVALLVSTASLALLLSMFPDGADALPGPNNDNRS